jgi:hypothetical protein
MKKNKTLVTVLVVLGLGAAVYFLTRKKGGSGNGGGGNGGGGTGIEGDYLTIANNLFDIFNGYGTVGTGANAVVAELKKLRSRSDWDKLVAAYGTRTVSSGTWNIFVSDFTGTLPECLRDELDSSELEDVNQELSRIGVSI